MGMLTTAARRWRSLVNLIGSAGRKFLTSKARIIAATIAWRSATTIHALLADPRRLRRAVPSIGSTTGAWSSNGTPAPAGSPGPAGSFEPAGVPEPAGSSEPAGSVEINVIGASPALDQPPTQNPQPPTQNPGPAPGELEASQPYHLPRST